MAGAAAACGPRRPRDPRGRGGRNGHAPRRRASAPLEHRMLMTATLCLLAFGAVMVYSASSPLGVLNGQGNGAGEFVRYLVFGAIGLVSDARARAPRPRAAAPPRLVAALLLGSFVLLVLVLRARLRRARSTAPGAGSRPARSSSSPPS